MRWSGPRRLTRREVLGAGARAAAGISAASAIGRIALQGRPAGESPSARVARLVLQTPREDVLEVLAREVRNRGLDPVDVTAGLHRASALRLIPTRYLGSEFHALLMAHPIAATAALLPPARRWEPVLLATDYFKKVEALHLARGAATAFEALPSSAESDPDRARTRLITALDDWDVAAAERAVLAFARAAGRAATFDLLFRYGARDLRQIGHKTILVANAWQVTAVVGWAECAPLLRSVIRGLLLHEEDNPNGRDSPFDAPWRQSREALGDLSPEWLRGTTDRTHDILGALRDEPISDVPHRIAHLLDQGASTDAFWTACSCAAAELLFRWPHSLVTLHAVTTMHALRTAFDSASTTTTRQLLVMQAAARLTGFRDEAHRLLGDPNVPLRIEDLEPVDDPQADPTVPAAEQASTTENAGRMLAVARARDHGALWRALVPKITAHALDIHDLKHPIAVYEDARRILPGWADRYLALSARDFAPTPGEPTDEHRTHAHKLCRDEACSARVRAALRAIRG